MISTILSAVILSAACVLAAKFVGGFNLVAVALTAGMIGAGVADLHQQMKPVPVVEGEEALDGQPTGEKASQPVQSNLEATDERWLAALTEFDEDQREFGSNYHAKVLSGGGE